MLPTRREAEEKLEFYVKDDYQIRHAKMVALACESYAQFANDLPEDLRKNSSDLYYITGLLHDIDYFLYPEKHPKVSLKWFEDWGYPKELIHAVEAHAYGYNECDVLPKSHLASTLMACDELSGFLFAYSLMRPTGFEGMESRGVVKRLKDKSFAAKINREDIYRGVQYLNVSLEDHIARLIEVFKNQNKN